MTSLASRCSILALAALLLAGPTLAQDAAPATTPP